MALKIMLEKLRENSRDVNLAKIPPRRDKKGRVEKAFKISFKLGAFKSARNSLVLFA